MGPLKILSTKPTKYYYQSNQFCTLSRCRSFLDSANAPALEAGGGGRRKQLSREPPPLPQPGHRSLRRHSADLPAPAGRGSNPEPPALEKRSCLASLGHPQPTPNPHPNRAYQVEKKNTPLVFTHSRRPTPKSSLGAFFLQHQDGWVWEVSFQK